MLYAGAQLDQRGDGHRRLWPRGGRSPAQQRRRVQARGHPGAGRRPLGADGAAPPLRPHRARRQDKDWPGALSSAKRLTTQFKDADVADDALARIVEGAAEAKAWRTVSEAYQALRQQYPRSTFIDSSRARFAEAELEEGRPDLARRELEQVIAGRSAAEAGPAFLLLGRAREATGDRAGALDAYSRAAQAGVTGTGVAALGQARLLLDEKKWGEARGVVEPLMRASDAGEVAQAAQALGRSYQGEGNHQAAVEYYMTAAYLAPESPAGRQAMLGAARSLAALKQPDSAALVYRKLLAQTALPADVADAARQGLSALGRPAATP